MMQFLYIFILLIACILKTTWILLSNIWVILLIQWVVYQLTGVSIYNMLYNIIKKDLQIY